MNLSWEHYTIAPERSHHSVDGRPAYESRFHNVLSFHAPGLAAVSDDSGAYHIQPTGWPAYSQRYRQTFGFYEGRAAVHGDDGWFHILPNGRPLCEARYAWCGNYQEGRCTVRHFDGLYSHIQTDGTPVYSDQYRYSGDYHDGFAVVQRNDGLHTHIDLAGNLLHGFWFRDLDVFHKGYARACDKAGWHHIDMRGEAAYSHRFKAVEPFYNGQARAEDFEGVLLVIDEQGETVVRLRGPLESPLERVSADLVGFWRTQTMQAAVELGVFDLLPMQEEDLETRLGLTASSAKRLLRALWELGLVTNGAGRSWYLTERGSLLTRTHPTSMAEAAILWGKEHYQAWTVLTDALRSGLSPFKDIYGKPFFEWLSDHPERLDIYQAAMSSYGRHDYALLCELVDFSRHHVALDAGGGHGQLLFTILQAYPELRGILMDRPEVVTGVNVPGDLTPRCDVVVGDLFSPWPAKGDAILLARVLHDWPDEDALSILQKARGAIQENGRLYVIEMVLDEHSSSGGLLDLNMLVMTGGAERTQHQLEGLISTAGFRFLQRIDTPSVISVLVAEA